MMKRQIIAVALSGILLGSNICTAFAADLEITAESSEVDERNHDVLSETDSVPADTDQDISQKADKASADMGQDLSQEAEQAAEDVRRDTQPNTDAGSEGETGVSTVTDDSAGVFDESKSAETQTDKQNADFTEQNAEEYEVLTDIEVVPDEEAALLEAITPYTHRHTYTLSSFGTVDGIKYDEINTAASNVISKNEGTYTSVTPNDNGALSIGKMQWHADRALELLRLIVAENNTSAYNCLGDTLYNEVIGRASAWSNRVLTSAEAAAVGKLLGTSESKKVQDAMSKSDIYDYLNHGYKLGIRNAAALVYFSDLENQFGSGGVVKFVNYAYNIAGSWDRLTLNELHEGTISYLVKNYKSPYLSYLIPRRRSAYGQIVSLGWKKYWNSGDYCIPYDTNGYAGASWIQNNLNYYQKAGLTVNGKYDDRTKAAVKAFQSAEGLSADGYAGVQTSSQMIYKMYGELASTGSTSVSLPLLSGQNGTSADTLKWVKDGNTWRCLHSNGTYTKSAWELIDGKWYYFDSQGVMQTGWVLLGGKWYYLNSSGAMVTGWQKIGGVWYYLDQSSGAMKTGWQRIGGVWYYLDQSSGAMKTGWQKIGGVWYYLDQSSGAMKTGWQKIGGVWYYLDQSSGAMKTGWQRIGGVWYYLDLSSGAMKTGWQKIYGVWYYLDQSSGAMKTGWQKIYGVWYYLDLSSGAMQTGWQKIDGVRYYLDPSSGAMATGWIKVGSAYYYLYSDGHMAANEWIGNYYVNSSGVWTKTK